MKGGGVLLFLVLNDCNKSHCLSKPPFAFMQNRDFGLPLVIKQLWEQTTEWTLAGSQTL